MTPASETPVKIEHKWLPKRFNRSTGTDERDYYYLVTFADGTSQEMGSVPNAWHEAVERKEARAA